MRLRHMEREWIEVQKADGSVVRFMAHGLGDGRLHLSVEGDGAIAATPDGESLILSAPTKEG